jgi:hypothetical protein
LNKLISNTINRIKQTIEATKSRLEKIALSASLSLSCHFPAIFFRLPFNKKVPKHAESLW